MPPAPPPAPSPLPAPIPLTVLTGFLGSGKTTLLARLLRTPAFAATAVIVNELGEVGIDHDLIATSEDRLIALETGCLCCEVRGDLEATLADLMARRAAGSVPAFARIVIETSGLADPAPILNAVMAEAGRGAPLALTSVVTTVDAVGGLASLVREPQSVRQVAIADRLILTKCDLVPAEPAELVERLAQLNPAAALHRAIKGDIDPGLLVGSVGTGRDRAATIEAWLAADRLAGRDQARTPGRQYSPARHGDDIVCFLVRRERPLPALALTLFLEALAEHAGERLLRLKGLVNIAERPDRPAVVHGTQHVFHEPEWLESWPSADRSSRLVLIGRGLSQLWTEALLEAIEAELGEVSGNR